jgi:hypothetical protein
MDISQLPKGCLVDQPDQRDFAAGPLLASLPPVDWNKGSGLSRPPLRDQNQADTCVAHSWSYYHQQIKGVEFSRRDLFARIAEVYGAYIRSGGWAIVTQGQQTEAELPDPSLETPANMRDRSGVDPAREADDQEINSFVVGNDAESVARAIVAYKGVVGGLTGSNPGWQDLTNPRPPQAGETTWGHALYFADFHIHSGGQKCIIGVTSWPNAGVIEHHIRENYFTSGNTFNPWTLIPKEQQMQVYVISRGSTFGIAIDSPLGTEILWAKDMATFKNLADNYGMADRINQDGTIKADQKLSPA